MKTMIRTRGNHHAPARSGNAAGARDRRSAAAFALLAALAAPAVAQDAPSAAPAPAPFAVNGFLSLAYSHNLNRPAAETNAFRVFDFGDDDPKLDVVELVLQRPATAAGRWGFRADLTAGQSVPRVAAASGLFRDTETGRARDLDLQQAYVSWVAPLGQGLRFDVGKFVTHAGAELIEGYDGFNDNYSRSFLFGYAIPFTHTGAKVSYSAGKVGFMALAVQGWDNVKDNNGGKTFGGQLAVSPSAKVALYFNYLGGPERAGSDDVRHLADAVLVWKPSERLALTFNYDFATEAGASADGRRAEWSGFAGGIRLSLARPLVLAVRAERFEDRDGVRTGAAQALTEVTVTPEWRIHKYVLLRGEVRHDRSDAATLSGESGPSKSQTTLALNLLALF